jgi:hypothetical protein
MQSGQTGRILDAIRDALGDEFRYVERPESIDDRDGIERYIAWSYGECSCHSGPFMIALLDVLSRLEGYNEIVRKDITGVIANGLARGEIDR